MLLVLAVLAIDLLERFRGTRAGLLDVEQLLNVEQLLVVELRVEREQQDDLRRVRPELRANMSADCSKSFRNNKSPSTFSRKTQVARLLRGAKRLGVQLAAVRR